MSELGKRNKKPAKLAAVNAAETKPQAPAMDYPRIMIVNVEGALRIVAEKDAAGRLEFVFERHVDCSPSGSRAECTWAEINTMRGLDVAPDGEAILTYAALCTLEHLLSEHIGEDGIIDVRNSKKVGT